MPRPLSPPPFRGRESTACSGVWGSVARAWAAGGRVEAQGGCGGGLRGRLCRRVRVERLRSRGRALSSVMGWSPVGQRAAEAPACASGWPAGRARCGVKLSVGMNGDRPASRARGCGSQACDRPTTCPSDLFSCCSWC
jgi:hypothetical protein